MNPQSRIKCSFKSNMSKIWQFVMVIIMSVVYDDVLGLFTVSELTHQI